MDVRLVPGTRHQASAREQRAQGYALTGLPAGRGRRGKAGNEPMISDSGNIRARTGPDDMLDRAAQ